MKVCPKCHRERVVGKCTFAHAHRAMGRCELCGRTAKCVECHMVRAPVTAENHPENRL